MNWDFAITAEMIYVSETHNQEKYTAGIGWIVSVSVDHLKTR